MKKVELTPEIMEQVKKIPDGTIGVSSSDGFFETSIKIFYIVRIVATALKNKQITLKLVWELYQALLKMKVNHVFIYWGNGNWETVDATPRGVVKGNLLVKIMNGSGLRLFSNSGITMENIKLAKIYSYGTVGRPYGYPDFASFVTDLLREIFPAANIPNIKPSIYMDHCAENATTTMDVMLTGNTGVQDGIFIPSITDRSKVHPQDVLNYLESDEAIIAKWQKVYDNRPQNKGGLLGLNGEV